MDFDEEFHFIIGDLVIGNVKNEELPKFVKNIHKSLKKDGIFATKSFFIKDNYIKLWPRL